jgi:hydroxyethylthiazole kinase-like uncharacterized protein yjeF
MPIARIATPADDLPLRSVAATRAIESRAAAALPAHALMQRAGAAVARLALALAPHAERVRVCAGPGNNGGDGFEAARHLHAAGRIVELVFVGDAGRLPPDAAAALKRLRETGVAIAASASTPLAAHDLAIDALLGIGARRAPEGTLAQAVAMLSELPCPVLAIDLPSGLDADTGQPFGTACVRADHTLALLTLKPGLFTAAGRAQAGTVWFDDLDVAATQEEPAAWLAGNRAATAARRHDQHKGSFGDLAVVGGAPGMAGAALLAARAAHAAGAGRVFVQRLDDTAPLLDVTRPELMFRPHWSVASPPEVLGAATVACGCGGGDAVAAVLPRLLSLVPRLVLDADALNTIAADTALQMLLGARAARGHATVITPHPLEAARLLGTTTSQVQADRLAAVRELAGRHRCVVLLKGSGSVVGAPGQTPWILPTGNAALASPGTGDVLAGWIGGLWSQARRADAALPCTLSAAWRHGHAADTSGRAVMRAADLVERLAQQRAR